MCRSVTSNDPGPPRLLAKNSSQVFLYSSTPRDCTGSGTSNITLYGGLLRLPRLSLVPPLPSSLGSQVVVRNRVGILRQSVEKHFPKVNGLTARDQALR